MADDKARADKLAAARKKAQKKAAEAKAKKAGGKASTAKDEESKEEAGAAAESTEDIKEEAPAEEPKEDTTAEPEPEPEPTTADEPAPASEAGPTADTSALEAKVAELEKECAEARSAREEAQLMADALEKKVASLEMLHKEDEGQISRLQSDLSAAQNEHEDLKAKLARSEAEVLQLSKKDAQERGGTDNDHLDELEDEERKKLEARIRELEAENSDLRRGVWLERRKDMQPGMDEAEGRFTSVDLSAGAVSPGTQRRQGGFGDFFASGLNALTGAGAGGQQPHAHGHGHGHEGEDDGFLDDDDEFDEEAFRKAQEEAAKARIERIKEVKRGLKNFEGWRLDLVEGRRGGGEGIGEIFEV